MRKRYGNQEPSTAIGGHSTPQARRGFTLIELLVVIAIIAVLAALLLPALSRAKGASKSTYCKNNARQLAIALGLYTGEWRAYPYTANANRKATWYVSMAPYYNSNYSIMQCPTFKGEYPPEKAVMYISGNPYTVGPSGGVAGVSYGYNGFGVASAFSQNWPDNFGLGWQVNPGETMPSVKVYQVESPSDMIALADSVPQPFYPDHYTFLLLMSRETHPDDERHNGESNVAFVDGHVISISNEELIEDTMENRRRWNRDNQPHNEVVLTPKQ